MLPPGIQTRWALAVLVAGGTLGPAARAQAADAQRKPDVILRVSLLGGGSGVPSINPRTAKDRAERAVFDAFLARRPDVAFDETRAIRLRGTAEESGTLLSMAGRTAGDIQYINPRSIDNFVREGFLVPLDDYVMEHFYSEARQQGAGLPEGLSIGDLDARRNEYLPILRIKPEIWEVFYRPGVYRTPEGKDVYETDRRKWHVWAWPYSQESIALFYRRDNLARKRTHIAAALAQAARDLDRPEMLRADPQRPPRTWEEMIVYCTVLTDPATGEYGFCSYPGAWHFLSTLWQGGSEVIQRDSRTGDWMLMWNAPGSLDAVRYWRELFNTTQVTVDSKSGRTITAQIAYLSGAGGTQMNRDFNEARLTFMYDYTTTGNFTYSAQEIDPSLLGLAPLPAGPIQIRAPDVHLLEKPMLSGWDGLVRSDLLEEVTLPADRARPTELEWGRVLPHDWDQAKRFAEALGVREYLDQAAEAEKRCADPDRPGWFLFAGRRTAPRASLANYGDGWRIRANEVNASMYGITPFARQRHPRQERTAWEFTAFRSSREARRIETRAMVEVGLAIYLNPTLLREFGYEEYYSDVPREWRQANEEVFTVGRPEPNGKNCQQIYQSLNYLAEAATAVGGDEQRRALARNPLVSASWRLAMAGRTEELVEHLRRSGKGDTATQENLAILQADADSLKGPLSQSIERARRDLLGEVDESQVAPVRKWVYLVVGLIAVGFPVGLYIVARGYGQRGPGAAGAGPAMGSRVGRRTHLTAWAFLSVAVGTIVLWSYVPLGWGSLIVFQDYHVMGGSMWVGLENFVEVLSDPMFWKAVVNTFIYVALSLGMGFVLPIFLAIMLDEIPKGKLLFRVVFYLPAVMSGVIVAFLWVWFYKADADGLLNRIYLAVVPGLTRTVETLSPYRAAWGIGVLAAVAGAIACGVAAGLMGARLRRRAERMLDHTPRPLPGRFVGPLAAAGVALLVLFGLASLPAPRDEPVKWIEQNRVLAMVCVILPTIWAGVGPGCIIYLAALKSIPEEIYEAADLDGAGPLGKIRHVTLPYLKALIVINFVGAFIGAFKSWEGIFVMTGGGPNDATRVLGLHVWYSAFAYLKFGYATAMAWIIGSAMIGFTVYQLRILRKMRFTTARRE